jgi:hypothetical protein
MCADWQKNNMNNDAPMAQKMDMNYDAPMTQN